MSEVKTPKPKKDKRDKAKADTPTEETQPSTEEVSSSTEEGEMIDADELMNQLVSLANATKNTKEWERLIKERLQTFKGIGGKLIEWMWEQDKLFQKARFEELKLRFVTVQPRIVSNHSVITGFYRITGFHCTRFHWSSSL